MIQFLTKLETFDIFILDPKQFMKEISWDVARMKFNPAAPVDWLFKAMETFDWSEIKNRVLTRTDIGKTPAHEQHLIQEQMEKVDLINGIEEIVGWLLNS